MNIHERLPSSEIILVTPCDVVIPSEAVQSLQEIAKLAEGFFAEWLNHWGYPPQRQEIFSRGAEGLIFIRTVSGAKSVSSGAYDSSEALKISWPQTEIVKEVVRTYSIPQNGNYFWMFIWLGRDRKFKGWNGSGGPRTWGHCIVPYPEGGRFPLPKTHFHEFAHALGLPHIGPRRQDNGLCSLMGPNDDCYLKRMGRGYDNFCLTPAEAAMLWKHPVFSGTVNDRTRFPAQLALSNYRAEFDARAEAIVITGTLHTDLRCHSVVVVDDAQGIGEYWRKGYVGQVGEDGAFNVCISEPAENCGRFMILPCFENGVNTGDGVHHGLCSAISKRYHWTYSRYRFEE